MKKIVLLICFLCVTFTINAQQQSQGGTSTLNNFAVNLYKQLAVQNKNQNIALSPFGVTSVLNILYPCTAGSTQQEIGKLLGELNNQYMINQLTQSLISTASCGDHFYCRLFNNLFPSEMSQFIFGNALWVQSGISINQNIINQFNDIHINHYYVDFTHNPDNAITQINKWAANLTEGYIGDIVSSKTVSNDTAMVVTNAIYFKGLWQKAFDTSDTVSDTFYLNNGQTKNVDMMSQTENFAYANNNSAQMLIMTYKHTSLAMAIILPKQESHINQFISALNTNFIVDLINNAQNTKLMIKIPKFTVQSTLDDMEKNLQNLGIKQIFTDQADFSPLTKNKLRLSKVIQKTYVQIDEKGTIATAATAGVVMFGTAPPPAFKVNHPFIFVIYDTKTKLILFIGDVMDPSQVP